jgi:TolA-binding protein
MNCREVEERDILEEYLCNRLPQTRRDEFEEHYFECDSCFSRLQTGLVLQEELRNQPFDARKARTPISGKWFWTPAFAAIALLLVAGVLWQVRRMQVTEPFSSSMTGLKPESIQPTAAPESLIQKPEVANARSPETSQSTKPSSSSRMRSKPELAQQASPRESLLNELAIVKAPPYFPYTVVSGTEERSRSFQAAMQPYLEGDYVGAIPGLSRAVSEEPENAELNFYLGISYLLTGQIDPAITTLRTAISLRDPRYTNEAHFYLAKAYLAKRDVASAKDELRLVDPALELAARSILDQLEHLPAQSEQMLSSKD